ncbi:hypothetical protein FGG08_002186 [Glutinoglossum americanum]|uniref:WW domain-containing protein n=1 Tax=Glutinoglossum americanum TaxID=1670608 RepID=A0A9P8I9R6_9PEZI|nr:hypothetical protein FGG08_002186 [Glutinoglossum americanum]
MAGSRPPPGKSNDELFLNKPSTEPITPTVGPLRINKHSSTSPEPRSGSAQGQHNGVAPPTRKQTFPLPPGASSSPNPLPYPDDRPRLQQQQSSGGRPGQLPYPDRDRVPTPERKKQSSPANSSSSPTEPATSPRVAPGRDAQKSSGLAERRGNAPRPLPASPDSDNPDQEGLFAKAPRRPSQEGAQSSNQRRRPSQTEINPYPEYHQQYWPSPVIGTSGSNSPDKAAPATSGGLVAPTPSSTVNRLSSTASTSTTRAQRGSPPPPETPVSVVGDGPPGGGIEARFAAAGIAGTSTLNSLQAQGAAASQRANQYPPPVPQLGQLAPGHPAYQQQQQDPPQRPWTPTEPPGSQPYGPPTVYQGPGELPPTGQAPQGAQPSHAEQPPRSSSQQMLEQDFQRMQMTSSPPPAYSSVSPLGATAQQGYPPEKSPTPVAAAAGATAAGLGAAVSVVGAPPTDPAHQTHPAFANDPRQSAPSPQQGQDPHPPPQQAAPSTYDTPHGPAQPASPPPLPEGWIAHLDPNSGQYYYIHLPTQSTQWEFPKGPTPLNLSEPISPTLSTYAGHPLASPGLSQFGKTPLGSPGFAPMTPGYSESIMSMSTGTTATAGFTGPPPSSGMDMYKVAPTNGVYFGPYLRYTNMDLERGLWLGSIMLVTDAPQPPTIHIHQSLDLSPNPRQLKANPVYTHQRWVFYRYDIDLQMEESGGAKWTYAITSHLGCTRYEFLVAGRYETSWRFIAHSGNDFSLHVNANERSRLGGVGFMWKDVMQKHIDCGGFHAQLGLGDQIYADRLWKEIPLLKEWLGMSGKANRKNASWTAKHEEDVSHAYFHYYSSHFDQPHLREGFAQIPHILQIDDHDIFDGFGSYPEYMQFSNMFKNIGRIGIEMYLLFQHHTTLEILRNVSNDQDLFTITGTGWHFVKYLGPAVVVVGPDCRSERNPHQVMAGPTYQGLFPKVAMLPPSVQHCIWMISVPIVYPRMEAAESLANTVATGKKAMTGAYNVLGKVTSSVAGVVGAKTVVGEGFNSVKKAVGKSGLMGGILSPFGEIDMLDELRDQWTHESKDLERTYLIRTLQGIAHQKSIRMTFLSGGLVHDPSHPSDHKTMYQIISSAIVNVPPPSYLLKMLHNNKVLYIPQNGQRSNNSVSDTKEDMMEIFLTDVNGTAREMKKLMGRRNYAAFVAFDPDLVGQQYQQQPQPEQHASKLSLAVDFMVQGDGIYSVPMKYGPVVIPRLEYGA